MERKSPEAKERETLLGSNEQETTLDKEEANKDTALMTEENTATNKDATLNTDKEVITIDDDTSMDEDKAAEIDWMQFYLDKTADATDFPEEIRTKQLAKVRAMVSALNAGVPPNKVARRNHMGVVHMLREITKFAARMDSEAEAGRAALLKEREEAEEDTMLLEEMIDWCLPEDEPRDW